MSPFVELKNLGHQFQSGDHSLTAYENLNISLSKGDFLCVLGPSGCGKTTLLRDIGGFGQPTSGEVLVGGQKVTQPGLHCSMVFQTFDQLLAWKTVLGNVIFPLHESRKCATRKEERELAMHHLEMVGLSKYANYYPHQLSGGMKQRVAIARALAIGAELMLMDEPFASLDADTRTMLQKELLRIWDKTGITIIFVTHSIIESIALSTRLLAMGEHPECIKLLIDNPVEGKKGILRTPESRGYSECWARLSEAVRK